MLYNSIRAMVVNYQKKQLGLERLAETLLEKKMTVDSMNRIATIVKQNPLFKDFDDGTITKYVAEIVDAVNIQAMVLLVENVKSAANRSVLMSITNESYIKIQIQETVVASLALVIVKQLACSHNDHNLYRVLKKYTPMLNPFTEAQRQVIASEMTSPTNSQSTASLSLFNSPSSDEEDRRDSFTSVSSGGSGSRGSPTPLTNS